MQSSVTEIASDVFRISTFNPDYHIQFNQFLIRDDEPFLMHTGFWDAGLFFEQTDGTLLCSDLFFHPGNPEALTERDIVGPATAAIRGSVGSPLAKDIPYTPYTEATLQRLARLAPKTLAVMHGSSFRGDGSAAIGELAQAIRETHGAAVQ